MIIFFQVIFWLMIIIGSFLLGFGFCLWGVHNKVKEIEGRGYEHHGLRWVSFKEWITK